MSSAFEPEVPPVVFDDSGVRRIDGVSSDEISGDLIEPVGDT